MRRLMTIGMIVAATSLVAAQKTTEVHKGTGGSPHVRTQWTIDGANISLEYGRPFLKGRSEAKMMPAGQVWRTGADEATTLKTDKALTFGKLTVPAGTYTVWTMPGDKEWQLIINKQTGQWGTEYAAAQDLGRVPMQLQKLSAPAEQLTLKIEDTAAGGELRVEWGTYSARAPFTVGK